MDKRRKALHFGICTSHKDDTSFNGEKDADYFHLFSKQKGYDSNLVLSSKTKICAKHIKEEVFKLKSKNTTATTYFISISGFSYVEKSFFGFLSSRQANKAVMLSDEEMFTRKDLLECLSLFDKDDKVFFLISDCETKSKKPIVKPIFEGFDKNHVKVKAAVLSLGLNQRAMKHLNVSSCAVDFEYAMKSAKTFQELMNNLNDLNEANISFVNSSLGCYNTHKNSELVL